jgi:hypothetical protein
MNKQQRARKILNDYLLNGGYNFSKTGEHLDFKEGYIYSLKDHETIINIKTSKDLIGEIEKDLIKKLETIYSLTKNKTLLNLFIGFWKNGDKLYIDISTITDSLERAKQEGKLNNQIAILDAKNLIVIKLNEN